MRKYYYTNQNELRRVFREENPGLSFRKNKNGDYNTTTRCTFNDWIDYLQRDGQISEALAKRATL